MHVCPELLNLSGITDQNLPIENIFDFSGFSGYSQRPVLIAYFQMIRISPYYRTGLLVRIWVWRIKTELDFFFIELAS